MKASLALLTVIVISTARKGLAFATFVDPPSGSTIARLEGAMNPATLTCIVTLSDGLTQTFTEWFVRNFMGNDGLQVINDDFFPEIFSAGGDPLPTNPNRTFRNQLTLLNFTAELDGITIFCGTGGVGNQELAKFYLRVYTPPGPPLRLNVDSSTATSFVVCWEAPLEVNSPISFYTVSARNLNDTGGDDGAHVVTRNTTNNSTFSNVTGLLPGTTYELTVVAVSQGGDVVAKSQASEPVVSTTGLTVPAPICSAPLSSNGIIIVTWSYVHTGGLPLTNVSVEYRFEEGASISPPTDVDIDNVEVTTAMVSNLIAGRFYTFTVIAKNSIGSTSIDCGPIHHRVGVPAMPSFGELTAGPDPGQVTIQIKTIASGLSDRDARGFEFVLIPILNGASGNELRFPRPDYQSGTLETIAISNLSPGQSYTFIATAVNFFGISSPANSAVVRAAGLDPIQPSPGSDGGSSNVGAITGGVVGVLLSVVFIIIITATVAISIRLRYYSKDHSKSVSNEVPLYDEPDNFRQNTANASDIELKDCPAYDKVQKETHIELEQCPAYGEI